MIDSEQVVRPTAATMRRVRVVYLILLWLGIAGPLGKVEAQSCQKPQITGMRLIAEDLNKEVFPDGTQVTLECTVGYTTGGGSGITICNAGTWSTVSLVCTRYQCVAIEISNGDVEYLPGHSFGDQVSFTCKDGFVLVGVQRLTCGSDGWKGRIPTCEVKICLKPKEVANAKGPMPDLEEYPFSSVVSYSCQEGFTINGSSSLTCSKHGNFTPSPPTCIVVSCEDPVVLNARKTGARPPYGLNSFVSFECNVGHKLVGSRSITCQLNSQWTTLPICKAIQTTTTTTTTKATTTTKPTIIPDIKTTPCSSAPPPPPPPPPYWVILLCICFVIIILLIIVILIIWKKRGSDARRKSVPVEVY